MIHHPLGRSTDMIGHNIRPGMVPGGFSPGFFVAETVLGRRRGRPRKYREVSVVGPFETRARSFVP